MKTPESSAPVKPKMSTRSLLWGGIVPVVLFTVIEETYGTLAGLVAGMIFGVGEIFYEWRKHGSVSKITWFGNGLLLFFGALSLWTNEGFWFMLQPALMEASATVFLWGSLLFKKNVLQNLAEAQGAQLPPMVLSRLKGITFRCGGFFLIHAALATWAALKWTTVQWALLKGVGLTLSMIVYMIIEGIYLRLQLKKELKKSPGVSAPGPG